MHIAFIGVGLMGAPMVTNLIRAGFSLHLWNRTQSKLDPFQKNANTYTAISEAVAHADIIITMLETGDIVEQTLMQGDVLQAIKSGSMVVDMSSIPPEQARAHAQLLKNYGISYLDAPVSGGTVGAEQATLSIMAGGNKNDFDKALPIFNAMGSATHIGPHGTGQVAKLANQAIVGITIGAVSEALLLAAEGGADPVAVRKALGGGFAASRILELHGQRMIDGNYEPGARSRVQLKDMRTILDEARLQGLTLPLSQRTHDGYLSLIAHGKENIDHSGLMVELERLNNTSHFAENKENA
ncbi:2-hydroxy-3-oxopropionate reductase [Oleiphilus sp. HI0009]|uniref:NAD(P)-dependent oxidoreductase n=4 Tax=Oleiphilus sp. HI0125 TaxID=1822266 RepID=UPI0007C230F9|nr:NAD(P)-dependent oxidoreductase [Oleiphilus sp. HI0125]KZX73480.1 2-hydroxy-3-oxopropionate reductase [Oleiphilus sp. HI0009]KZZ57777.1 2-hydroxy-3-oxopropionate reductase [Oleiphilus sp. HI0125]